MPAWKFTPVSIDGVSLTAAPYTACFMLFGDHAMAQFIREPVEVGVPGDFDFPDVVRSQPQSGEITLIIHLASSNDTDVNSLRRTFDRYKGDVEFIHNDANALGWKTTVRIVELREHTAIHWSALLHIERPIWERTASTTDGPRSISASPTSFDLNSGGVVRAYPEFQLSATAAKAAATDFRYGWYSHIAWRSEEPGHDSLGNAYPIDICNDAFDTAAEIAAGRMQADGDDLRVFVDGEEYPRLLNGINTTTTKVWVPIHFSPGLSVTMSAAAAAGTPPTGGNWDVAPGESLVGWPAQGCFRNDDEVTWYGRRTDTQFQLIQRGYKNTTAASHILGSRADWIEHDIQIVSGNSALTVPTVPALAIDSGGSTNLAWTMSTFLTLATQRHGQMLPRFTEDNIKAAFMSLDEGTSMLFTDIAPGGVHYPYNNMELYVPCGVKEAAAALAFDVADGDNLGNAGSDMALNLRVFGVDVDTGVEQLLATYRRAERDAGAAKTITPTAVLSRVRFNVIYNVITGAFVGALSSAADVNLGAAGRLGTTSAAQQFTVDQDCVVDAVAMALRENAGADTKTIEFIMGLAAAAWTDPDDSIEIFNYTILNAALLATYQWVPTDVANAAIKAGEYTILAAGSVAGAGTMFWGTFTSSNPRGANWLETAGVWAGPGRARDNFFLLCGKGDAVQSDAPTGMGGWVNFDNIVVTFDDTTPRTPSFLQTARQDIYPLRGRIEHVDLGFYIDVFYIARLNEVLTIRTKTKEVILNETLKQYAPWAITPSDPEQWFYLRGTGVAADNTVRYTEAGVGTVSLTTVWADSWA